LEPQVCVVCKQLKPPVHWLSLVQLSRHVGLVELHT